MAKPYIVLVRSGMSIYVSGRTQGYRMTIQAQDAVVLPNEVFVYQRKPSYKDPGYEDVFTNIASPSDLEEYPITTPVGNVPFFRLAAVDLVFRNVSLADDAWKGIQNDMKQLIETLKFFDSLVVQEVEAFGTAPSSSSSSSSS